MTESSRFGNTRLIRRNHGVLKIAGCRSKKIYITKAGISPHVIDWQIENECCPTLDQHGVCYPPLPVARLSVVEALPQSIPFGAGEPFLSLPLIAFPMQSWLNSVSPFTGDISCGAGAFKEPVSRLHNESTGRRDFRRSRSQGDSIDQVPE